MTLATRDLYRLRKANLEVQRALLKAQTVQQTLREIALELERKYGLLGREATVDIHTGKIQIYSELRPEVDPDSASGDEVGPVESMHPSIPMNRDSGDRAEPEPVEQVHPEPSD